MATPSKLKIFAVGPQKAGKTAISNHLADLSESLTQEYHPTEGVRILEFERRLTADAINEAGAQDSRSVIGGGRAKDVTVSVELWDCSGDPSIESVWPAVTKEANGMLLIYNPDAGVPEKELETWHSYFPLLRDAQCLVLAHRMTSAPGKPQKAKFAVEQAADQPDKPGS